MSAAKEKQDRENEFESNVRRIASILWSDAYNKNSSIHNGKERDGVFITRDSVNIIESTVSKSLEKAIKDLDKSVELVKELRGIYQEYNFKIWFITENDPTAHQSDLRSAYRSKAKCPVVIESFLSFRSQLFDSRDYSISREKYPFGSVRFPDNEKKFNLPYDEYIEQVLKDVSSQSSLTASEFINNKLFNLNRCIITGDYGSGKSMTLRFVYKKMMSRHLSSPGERFPIYINLRDHFGQDDPSEALGRHGRKIGLRDPVRITSAWRAGFTILMLDGFDELASSRFVKGAANLKQSRRQAMRLIYNFIRETPYDTPILLAGRMHYFDDNQEMMSAFGLDVCDVYEVQEFDNEQIIKYLSKKEITQKLPDWLPSRPLLLGVLASCGIISAENGDFRDLTPEKGWDLILDRICRREADQIDPVSIQPELVREFVEMLATKARETQSGRGPLTLSAIRAAFTAVFDMEPDEQAEAFLYRFAGLTAASTDTNAREFFDETFVDVCRVGDVVRFLSSPYDERYRVLLSAPIQMAQLGVRLAAQKLSEVSSKQISHVISQSPDSHPVGSAILDLLHILQELELDYDGDEIIIKDGFFEELYLYGKSNKLDRINFRECFFSNVDVDVNFSGGRYVKFHSYQISNLSGPVTLEEASSCLELDRSDVDCLTNEAQTNAAVMELDLGMNVKVLLTVLRKLFLQKGSGRRESAFFRGLDQRGRSYVPEILKIIQRYNVAYQYRSSGPVVWIADRSFAATARQILASPTQSNHEVVREVRDL